MAAMPTSGSTLEQSGDPSPDWEAFYRGYRKPGYVPGFVIAHKLGGGVFGVVFKARKESIGKPYAIKFLRVEDPGVRQQVVRELETVSLFAQVDHPNLVSIEDKGVVDGIPYIVMGFAGDETLKDRLEGAALAEEEALRIFVQVARGVHALHEHSLVHFDLKPANVFLKGEVARVGDYGLSKLITETAMSLTTGRGTPYYMAPEMLRRKGDHRADIYSLGVILFECLSGDVPFKGDSEWEVLKGHEEKAVVFPDAIPLRYRPLLGRMLAKDPAQRHQNLRDVLQELRAPADLGESVRVEPGSAPSRRRSPGETARAAVADARREAEAAVASAFGGGAGRMRHASSARGNWWPWAVFGTIFAFFAMGRRTGTWPLWLPALGIVVALLAIKRSGRRPARRPRRRHSSGFWPLIVALAFLSCLGTYVLLATSGPSGITIGTAGAEHKRIPAPVETSPSARTGILGGGRDG